MKNVAGRISCIRARQADVRIFEGPIWLLFHDIKIMLNFHSSRKTIQFSNWAQCCD